MFLVRTAGVTVNSNTKKVDNAMFIFLLYRYQYGNTMTIEPAIPIAVTSLYVHETSEHTILIHSVS